MSNTHELITERLKEAQRLLATSRTQLQHWRENEQQALLVVSALRKLQRELSDTDKNTPHGPVNPNFVTRQ